MTIQLEYLHRKGWSNINPKWVTRLYTLDRLFDLSSDTAELSLLDLSSDIAKLRMSSTPYELSSKFSGWTNFQDGCLQVSSEQVARHPSQLTAQHGHLLASVQNYDNEFFLSVDWARVASDLELRSTRQLMTRGYLIGADLSIAFQLRKFLSEGGWDYFPPVDQQ